MQRPVNASANLLEGSSIRRIVPETQAALRGRTNSNPSPETNVTNSESVADEAIFPVKVVRTEVIWGGGW